MMLLENAAAGNFFFLAPLVVLFPVAGLLINIIFGGRMSEKLIGTVASSAVGLSFFVAALQAVSLVSYHGGETVFVAEWMHIGKLQLDWALRVDTLSTTMMLVVAGVGALIHIYAIGYMHEDVRLNGDPGRFRRFFVFMNLFIAMMMLLVSSDNYLMLFVGWEGVGLCSYLLIGFWYDKGKDGIGNALAAKKAFIANRIGDFGFLIAAFMLFWFLGSLRFEDVFAQAPNVSQAAIFAITMFMLLGVTGKSAQIPLYVWLPDAMAGPTPVSALIHAATMVTAGVYLVARSAPLYTLAPDAQWWVATVGGVTALFAATIAVAQFDIKKVLAYSTISQLGFMVAAVGSGAYVSGIFHLVTHAFFKALLFLAAGSVILGVEHGLHHVEHDAKLKKALHGEHKFDPQDMRNMGGLWGRMRPTAIVYIIGAMALAGIFPLAGFWSKDEILLETMKYTHVFWMLVIAAFFTAFYMTRQVWLVFFGKARSAPAEHAHDNPPVIIVPLVILAALSALGGALNLPYLHTFGHWLEYTLQVGAQAAETTEPAGVLGFTWGGVDPVIAIGATLLALAGIALGYYFYSRRYAEMQKLPTARRADDPLRAILGPVFTFLHEKYKIDELYQVVILERYVDLAKFLSKAVDGAIDAIGNGLSLAAQAAGTQLRRLQNGYIRSYALSFFVGVVIIFSYLILR